jgi:tetratricopeptide (TPR) repeat protein
VPAVAPKQAYSREEVRRLLVVSERQLKSWEKLDLIASTERFSFSDLLTLRTLIGLRRNKVPTAKIRLALHALRDRLRDVRNPFTEVRVYSHGRKIQVQIAGQRMEPVSGQLLLNFDEAEITKLLSFPEAREASEPAGGKQKRRKDAERWFEKGLELEQTGAPMEDIIAAYRKAVEIDPASAGALVNLGTVYFNARSWREAERLYCQALEVDPHYALAHFNLGNLHDEKGERTEALTHYMAALRIHPNYADAHYNIALLYQSTGQVMNAVRHWKTYLKLDPAGSWADIARRELAKLKDSTVFPGLRIE